MAMGAGRRVLVVEDDEGMREAIESLLDAAGFDDRRLRVGGGAAGQRRGRRRPVRHQRPQAARDVGLELLAELRARGARPPVILITAHDAPGVRDDASATVRPPSLPSLSRHRSCWPRSRV